MFEPRKPGKKNLAAIAGAVLALASLPPAAAGDFQAAWHQVEFGHRIGASGIVFVDWDGGGQPALVAGGGTFGASPTTYWYEILHDAAGLSTGFATTEYPDNLTALLAVDADGDGDQELLVAHGQTFELWDAEGGGDPVLLSSATTTAAEIRSLDFADVDGDGRREYVFCSGGDLEVQDSVTGAIDHRRPAIGCAGVAVGNVDGDADLEIVVAAESAAGLVIDGAGFGTQWSHPAGFGKIVRIGDVDGDGANEIVAGYTEDGVRVFDAAAQNEQWAIPSYLFLDLTALRLLDTTGDGRPEIVYCTEAFAYIHLVDGISGGEIGSVGSRETSPNDVAYGDSDHDGQNELLWGAGFSNGHDVFYAYDLTTASLEAASFADWGPYYGFAAGDVEGDGSQEIVHTVYSAQGAHPGGSIFIRDAASRAVERAHRVTSVLDFRARRRVALAQLDADPALEIVYTRNEQVVALDGATLAQQWLATSASSQLGLGIGDLEGDGSLEVVVSTQRVSSSGSYLFVYDGATGALEWQSPSVPGPFEYAFLRLANVDADSALEIVIGENGGELQVWDGASRTRQLLTASLGITALDTADIDGDGEAEIYIGTGAGALHRIDPAGGAILATYGTYAGGAIQGLAAWDLVGDGSADLVFTAGGKLHLHDGGSGALVWQTARLGSSTAHFDSLRVGDFDLDGLMEIWLSLGSVGQMIFERPQANTPPVVAIGAPAGGAEITVGQSLAFTGSALDYEDGDLSGTLAWTSSLAGPIGGGASFSSSTLGVGTHLITAATTDSDGEPGQATITVHVRTLPVTVTLNSIGAEDGYLLESSENSEVGNYATATQWRIGDANNDRQYRSLLSFDTSGLPDDAIVLTAKVRVRRYNLTNTNPFTTHGDCLVDVKSGAFGASATLENADFEAPADAVAAAMMSNPPANLDWSEGLLDAAGRAALNTTGRTQMKLRFLLDDNDDNQEDYLNFFGGDNGNVDYRPKLVITYQQ